MATSTPTKDQQHFEKWSRTYETSLWQRIFFDRVHKALLTYIASISTPQTILDVGCGTGRLLRAAQKQWPTATLIGVDPTQGMIDVARQLTSNASFHLGTAESLPLPDATADIVLSTLSFHHWQDQLAGIREIKRVLRPHGQFFLVDAYTPAWLAPLIRHNPTRKPEQVRDLFTTAGLAIPNQQPILWHYIFLTVGRNQPT